MSSVKTNAKNVREHRDIQFSHASKSRESATFNHCDLVVVQVPVRVDCKNYAVTRLCAVTNKVVRLPSPVKAPLAIDVIWL